MQNTIFSTASDSFLVAHIVHVGPVLELSQQSRKSNNTHYFRITTSRGPAYCHFKSEDTARRSRGILGVMLGTVKPHLFRSKGDCIDISNIVSFGRVVKLKNSSTNDNHGFPVNLNTIADKGCTIWLTFQTEESAQNVRKALYASIMSYYQSSENELISESTENEDNSTVQAEVSLVEA